MRFFDSYLKTMIDRWLFLSYNNLENEPILSDLKERTKDIIPR